MCMPTFSRCLEAVQSFVNDKNATFAVEELRSCAAVYFLIGFGIDERIGYVTTEGVKIVAVGDDIKDTHAGSFDNRCIGVEMVGVDNVATNYEPCFKSAVSLHVEDHS
mmetsp:Transcript_19717/g.42470  ORF Transcript_19717/g.42470 Transcript_19717/m.42470 type:complete len:108 (-) Transcript_19717:79-402(-)